LITCSLSAAIERRATQCSTPSPLGPGTVQTDRSSAVLSSAFSVPHAVLRRGDGDGEAAMYMCAVALAESEQTNNIPVCICASKHVWATVELVSSTGNISPHGIRCIPDWRAVSLIEGTIPSRVYDKRLVLFVLAQVLFSIQSPLPPRHLYDRICLVTTPYLLTYPRLNKWCWLACELLSVKLCILSHILVVDSSLPPKVAIISDIG
jgi:hypothetical protein